MRKAPCHEKARISLAGKKQNRASLADLMRHASVLQLRVEISKCLRATTCDTTTCKPEVKIYLPLSSHHPANICPNKTILSPPTAAPQALLSARMI